MEGARRVWGTMKHTTTKTIKNAISRFCNIEGLSIRRKTRNNPSTQKESWWFVIHADEVLLNELESKWDLVNLQTSWVLQYCSKPAVVTSPTSSNADCIVITPSSPSIKFSARANPTSPQSPVTPELAQLNNPVPSLPSSSSDMCPFFRSPDRGNSCCPPHSMNTITLLHYNARSLFPKLDYLKVESEIHMPDIICITESWLDNCITNDELKISGFNLLHLDRNRHGGGIVLYIKDIFSHNIIFLGNCTFECIVVSVLIGSCKFCICLLYRPPSSSVDVLDNLYSVLCSLDVCLYSHFLLIGDFNVDFMSPNRPLFSKLQSIASSFVLSQVITEPTHYSVTGVPSIIDLAFVLQPSDVQFCMTTPPLSTSDHMGIFRSYKIPSANKRPRSSKREVWCYSHGDFEKANEMLDQIDWEHIIDENNVNVSWNNWQNVFLNVMSECIPRKILPCKKHLPWITPSIHMAIKRRNSLLNTYKRTNSQLKLIQYKQVRNRVVTELRKAKQMFFKRMRDTDSKSFWKLSKILTKKESSIPSLSTRIRNDNQCDGESYCS